MLDILTSRDNPLVKQCRSLAQDPSSYRKLGHVWLEGDHLVRALLARGRWPSTVVMAESRQHLMGEWDLPVEVRRVVVADRLMAWISGLESPPPVACLYRLPVSTGLQPNEPTVILDRLQDPGNVGSILRSAAAFGFRQILAIRGTSALWSPKVMRAGMGAHFALHLVEGLEVADLSALAVPLIATSSHLGDDLHQAGLPWPCAWMMGHEGQGVSDRLLALAAHHVRIPQPGGEESLNVAAAAAICLYTSAVAQASGRL